MFQSICPPSLENYLVVTGIKEKQTASDICFISDYSPSHTDKIHGGLQEAALHRLHHPAHYIFILSFFTKQQLRSHDKFDILELPGTSFFQLPFHSFELLQLMEKLEKEDLTIPKTKWDDFRNITCTHLLNKKISELNHGGIITKEIIGNL